MNISVDTGELERLADDLAQAAPRVVKASSASMTRIANQIRDDAKGMAPVDTGELRDSIKIQGGLDYRIVYTDVRYGPFVEFGTSVMSPQPYLWPQAGPAQTALVEAMERDSNPLD